ncbi:hypothetical protein [Cellulomonas alba]|uniref:Uncharacterized protein n=1 Tax=Cellulomonas alba TaxID=3053467 RepID=A0ABT7SC38_9CELL|nr:hypothetical protein [Cellulomonas alba]MDM7853750.1 hypothetical protein [Cellulomonas alba]
MTDLRPDPMLAARAASAAPPMELDPDAVLAAGRRFVRRRTALRLAGAAGGVAALMAVTLVTADLHGNTSAPPADGDAQRAHPIGSGRTTEVAEGLVATNLPGPAHRQPPAVADYYGTVPAAALETSIDLGLATGGGEIRLVVGPVQNGVQSGSVDSTDGGAAWIWGTPPRDSIDPGFLGAPADGGTWFDSSTNDGGRLGVAVVPLALPDPRVVVWSAAGFTVGDGSTSHAVEVPTFSDGSHHLLSVWRATGAAAGAFATGATGVVVVGSDGRVVAEPCEAPGGAACPQLDEVPGLAAAVRALGGALDGVPAPTNGGPVSTPSPAATSSAAGVAQVVAPDVFATTVPVLVGRNLELGTFGGLAARLQPSGAAEGRVHLDVEVGPGTAVTGPDTDLTADPVLGATSVSAPTPAMFTYGSVPQDLPSARAFYVSLAGFRLADGQVAHAVELPLFPVSHTEGGSLRAGRWFAVGAVGEAATRLLDTESGVLFGLPDGTVVDPACSGTCDRADAETFFPAVRALIGAPHR